MDLESVIQSEVSQKEKNKYHMTQQFHSWVYISKRNNNTTLKSVMYHNVHCSTIYNSQGMQAT